MGTKPTRRRPAGLRLAAAAGMLGPPLAAATVLWVGFRRPGYDPMLTTVSRLGERGAPGAPLVNLALGVLGLSLVALAWGLQAGVLGRGPEGPLLLGLAGLAVIGGAIFSVEHELTLETIHHRLAAVVALGCLALAPTLMARRLRADDRWNGYSRPSALVGGVALGLLLAALLARSSAHFLPFSFPNGAWERGFTLLTLGWAELMAVRLHHLARRQLAAEAFGGSPGG